MPAPSVAPHTGIKPDPAASPHVDVEERGIRKAPYPCEQSRTLDEEALDVGAVDVVDAKVERPSLRCGLGNDLGFVGISAAADHRDGAI